MEKIVGLSGRERDKETIQDNGTGAVYVLDVPEAKLRIGDYIDKLHSFGVKNRTLSALRVCSNIPLNGQVRVEAPGRQTQYPQDMAALLGCLHPYEQCAVTIVNDDRTLLAAVLQQLVYVDYPLTGVSMALGREAEDKRRAADFLENRGQLMRAAQNAEENLERLKQKWLRDADLCDEDRQDLDAMYTANRKVFEEIRLRIDKASGDEIKIVIAASKKTGKSTIVNSMIGTELAPTSLERPTPNTCIYRKSPDGQYHLYYNGEHRVFSDRAEIVRVLRDEFEQARSRADGSSSIPDMEIGYVSAAGDFDGCAIYDTPGPDLAGAKEHMESAYRAIKDADVVLFAFDFSKALTTSEEDYLRAIKRICDERGKIHSLLFSVNKMDQALLQSRETQSPIKSIDWIRSRLEDIDPGYADCVIFATSAQDYFNTLELEQLADDYPALQPLFADGANWAGLTREVVHQLECEGADDDVMALAGSIHSETERLQLQLEEEHVDKGIMQAFSGMPQLLQYVSYTATRKARDEMLNSILSEIGSLSRTAANDSSVRENTHELMEEKRKEMERADRVLEQFDAEVDEILVPGYLTRFDERHIPIASPLRELAGSSPLISLDRLVQRTAAELQDVCTVSGVASRLWPVFKEAVVDKLKSKKWKKFKKGKASVHLSDSVAKELSDVLATYLKPVRKCAKSILDRVIPALENVLAVRLSEVREKSEDCVWKLGASGKALHLPQNTSLDVSPKLPKPPSVSGDIQTVNLSGPLKRATEELWPMHQMFRNMFEGRDMDHSEVQIRDVSRGVFGSILDDYRSSFDGRLRETGILQMVEDYLKDVADRTMKAMYKAVHKFEDLTAEARSCADGFANTVDATEAQRRRLDGLQRKECYVDEIAAVTQKFQVAAQRFLTAAGSRTPT